MSTYSILVLNKHPEIFRRFYASLLESEGSDHSRLVVVCDNHNGDNLGPGNFQAVTSWGSPFVFSRNVNIGFDHLAPADVVLCNDDVLFVENQTLNTLAAEAGLFTNIGMVAPMIDGGVGNPYQDLSRIKELWPDDKWRLDLPGRKSKDLPICFICVYLKRQMIEEIGPMDERFVGYGFDDNDYCIRARRKNWRTTITRLTHVQHGEGGSELVKGKNWNCTYMAEKRESNEKIFREKYGGD